ncbi:MAG TPA: IS66 family transposase, partial [Chitinophagales bacterium]|nr:IS66 family transposase [Chitinophagales bacterium]
MVEKLNNLSKEELVTEVIRHQSQLQEKQSEVIQLKHQLSLYQKALFGDKKEEHKVVNLKQTEIAFEEKVDLDLPGDIELQQISYHRKKGKKKREDFSKLSLPDDLERVVTVIEPEGLTDDMERIGEEVTETLAITSEKFYVKVLVRPKYVKKNKEGVVIAAMPSRPIQGGCVDVSFLTTILLDKYINHMPLYRQLGKYQRLGVKLSDATLGDWVQKSMQLLEYLYQELIERVKNSSYIQADETTIKVLDKLKKGKSHRGYYWVYHDVENGLVLYEYDQGRGQTAPESFLHGYKGYLQTDGYSVYEGLRNKDIVHACCMAHARRKFHEALQNDKVKAEWMLDKIQVLYKIEEQARKEQMDSTARLALRIAQAQPILAEIKNYLNEHITAVLPKSPIGIAMNYMLARWDKLSLYATEGRLEIDN